MSASLVRRSLQLVDGEFSDKGKKKNKKSKGVFDLIPENQKSVKKTARGGKIERKTVYNISESSSKLKKKQIITPASTVEDNLRKLKSYGHTYKLNSEVINKIVKRARTGKAVIEIEEEKPDEKTVFTEEDFRKYEQEYS